MKNTNATQEAALCSRQAFSDIWRGGGELGTVEEATKNCSVNEQWWQITAEMTVFLLRTAELCKTLTEWPQCLFHRPGYNHSVWSFDFYLSCQDKMEAVSCLRICTCHRLHTDASNKTCGKLDGMVPSQWPLFKSAASISVKPLDVLDEGARLFKGDVVGYFHADLRTVSCRVCSDRTGCF